MPRRLWLSVAMLAVGAGLLATAQIADASAHRNGGVFRYGTTGASLEIDPQLAFVTTSWWLEYATAAKLYNYPDKRGPAGSVLVPEVASGYKVSKNGKTYTFTIRKGFRFSNGTPVTAKNFQYAIDRTANHDLASPGAQFITDPNTSEIVGAQAVNDGKATHVRGVTAKGNKLIIRLVRPDGTFMSKITMPFFQATPSTLPLTHEVVHGYASAGPYYIARNDVNTLTSLRRNPYYKTGPGRRRPHNLTGLDVQWNLNEQTAFNEVKANQLDEGPLPAAEVQGVADQYGVNMTRFWAKPINCIGVLGLNSQRSLFKNNAALRKALNWVVDRKAYAAVAGPYAGTPWTHILPPGYPGSITAKKLQPYAGGPRVEKARELAAGHFRSGKITVGYRSSGTISPAQAQIVRNDLITLGFQPGNITMKGFSGADLYDAMEHNSELDMGVSMGWCSDYPDPHGLLEGFVPAGAYQRKLAAANRLTGNEQLRAFGRLDLEMTRNLAPVVAMRTYNNRYFFSDRVDPKSVVYQNVYQDMSIPALTLK